MRSAAIDEDNCWLVIEDCPLTGIKVIEEMETKRAIYAVYEGAIFMHQSSMYKVKQLQENENGNGGGYALVQKIVGDYFTLPRKSKFD